MDGRNKRLRLGLALIVLATFVAVPSMADEKVNLFNPFSLQTKSVIVADSTPGMLLNDLILATAGSANGKLDADGPRPTISLRGQEIRIPSRPNLRSSFSRFPAFSASSW